MNQKISKIQKSKSEIFFAKLSEKLTGKDGKRNLIFMKTKTVENAGMAPDSWDFYNPEKKFIGMVNIEGEYQWVSFNDETDWDTRGNTEKIEEQYTEEQTKYFLKYGELKKGAGDVCR